MSYEVTIKLRQPVQIGSETVEELVLKPNARFYKDVQLTAGESTVTYKPYDFAVVGVRLAGRHAAPAFVDKMDPADMMEVAQAVMGFLGAGRTGGSESSP